MLGGWGMNGGGGGDGGCGHRGGGCIPTADITAAIARLQASPLRMGARRWGGIFRVRRAGDAVGSGSADQPGEQPGGWESRRGDGWLGEKEGVVPADLKRCKTCAGGRVGKGVRTETKDAEGGWGVGGGAVFWGCDVPRWGGGVAVCGGWVERHAWLGTAPCMR